MCVGGRANCLRTTTPRKPNACILLWVFFCILYNLIVYSYFIYLTVYACSVYLTVYGKCWGRGREAAPPLCREEHSESGPLAEAAAASQGERYPWPKASCGYGWSSAMVAFAQVTGGASPRVWTPMDLRLGPPACLHTASAHQGCLTTVQHLPSKFRGEPQDLQCWMCCPDPACLFVHWV